MKKGISKRLAPYIFSAPTVILMTIFMGFPILYGLILGFFQWSLVDLKNAPAFAGLHHFKTLFQNPQFWSSMKTTLIFVVSVIFVQLLLGMVIALLLEKNLPGIRFFRSIFMLPVMISPVVVGVIWKYIYDANFGMLNYLLGLIGVPAGTWLSSEGTALLSVIITEIWQWTPFVFLILLSGLQSVPSDLMEAAVVDGASYFQTLVHVKLPCMKNIIRLVLTLRMIESMRSMVVIFIMTGGGPGISTMTLPMSIYKDAFVNQDLGSASATAIILMIMLILLTVFVKGGKEADDKH